MQLHYTECGTGQPMVLLHGNGEDGSYFKHQIQYFSKRYRVIAVDTRGHGQSPRGSKPFTLNQFAKDLKKFLDQKRLRPVILLGFSDGGNIALIFALRYPEYVDRLILNGANLNPFGVKISVQLPVLAGYAAAAFKMRTECLLMRVRGKGQKARGGNSVKREWELLGLMVKGPWIKKEVLRTLSMPVLVIAGTDDMIRDSHTRKISKWIPDSRLTILKGSHFIAAKNSREFNRAVVSFLRATEGELPQKMRRLWENRIPGQLDRKNSRDFSVLVPLVKKEGEYHLLFEIRSDKLKHQPGEVCFPGGAVEGGETWKEAAIRETAEELCVDPSQIEMLAPLDILAVPAGLNVYPYLAELKDYRGTFSEDEVEQVFTVPLRWFAEHRPESHRTRVLTVPEEDFPYEMVPGGRNYKWRRGQYDVLFYKNENAVIWGMTAKILHSFVEMYQTDILKRS